MPDKQTLDALDTSSIIRGKHLSKRQRLLAGLFIALLMCDLLVAGVILGWWDRAAPAAASAVRAAQKLSQPRLEGVGAVDALRGGGALDSDLRGMDQPADLAVGDETRYEQATSRAAQERAHIPSPTPTSPAAGSPTPASRMAVLALDATTASSLKSYLPVVTATTLPSPTPQPTATELPSPPPPPDPPAEPQLPDIAVVEGVTGVNQSLPLSCESRSAADWARFFGYEISELEFQYALPFTDNPDTGFVGDPRGMGGIPPYNYGVHAGPVATLLRAYGLRAMDVRWMSYDELRGEIAAGRPVIVWVILQALEGSGIPYTASDGLTTTVAYGEHTVIVTGYTPDAVAVLDGGSRYEVPVKRFLNSWAALENQAVVSR